MLKALKIENFKAFGSAQTFPLAPITLLFGENSAGKSSVLQSILLLKQTLEESVSPETVLLCNSRYVNLGNYGELIYKHDTNLPLRLGYAFDPQAMARSLRRRSGGHSIRLPWCEFEFGADENGVPRFQEFTIGAGDWEHPVATYRSIGLEEFYKNFGSGIDASGYSGFLKLHDVNKESPLVQKTWERFSELEVRELCEDLELRLIPRIARKSEELKREYEEEIEYRQARIEKIQAMFNRLGGPDGEEYSERREEEEARLSEFKVKLKQTPSAKEKENMQFVEAMLERLRGNYALPDFVKDLFFFNNFLTPYLHFRPALGTLAYRMARGRHSQFKHLMDNGARVHRFRAVERWLQQVSPMLQHFFSRVVPLAPLREYPERISFFSGDVASRVGRSGKNMGDILFHRPGYVKEINYWLREFDIPYQMETFKPEGIRSLDLYSHRLVDQDTGLNVSFADVGFGMSQVLPILLQGLISDRDLITVEQPEIHLHPRLQAEFGSFLAGCIKRPEPNQFIIETHSEHLVLRLQRLIRNGELDASDVSVIYVERSADGSKAIPLRIDDEGDFIDDWPGGFFPERTTELLY